MGTIAQNERQVSPAMLLHRDDRPLHGEKAHEQIRGRRVLVTGAGGSIGSELVRQINGLEPASLFLLDHDENALHSLQLELRGHGLFDDDTTILADIREAAVTDRVMRQIRPNIVFHAAAHKHLPLLERYPGEGIHTNVTGTANVVSSALRNRVETFVNISTDKASSPTSVLGATKRLAEIVVASHAGRGMHVASVRFGNVLGSHGSFLQSMAFQIRNRLPVTVTDPDVTRFFMTVSEAASLVIEASTLADHGEIYVLDMGEPVRILEIVARYLQATGSQDIPVTFTGLRPGEKMNEELFSRAEIRHLTANRRIWRAISTQGGSEVLARILALASMEAERSAEDLRRAIFALLSSLLETPSMATRLAAVSGSRSMVHR